MSGEIPPTIFTPIKIEKNEFPLDEEKKNSKDNVKYADQILDEKWANEYFNIN